MWIVTGIAIVLVFVFCVGKHFNTYILIARNTTYICEILSTDFKDQFPNEGVLLATSGAIDVLKYVMEGSLPVGHIVTGAQTSEFGSCHLDFMNINMSDNPARELFIHDTSSLLYFIMQLEALIFHIDTRVPPEHILSAVKSKKRIIEKEVKKTHNKYEAQGAPPWLKAKTYAFMNGEAFAELRDELGIIKDEIGRVVLEAKEAVRLRGQHYAFVHQVLRDLFFNTPERVINIMTGDGATAALLDLWHRVGTEFAESYLVSPDGLRCEMRMLDKNTTIALITLPAPKFMCEAHYAALVYRPSSPEHEGITRFIVLERTVGRSLPVLCEWGPADKHINMGPIDGEPTLETFFEEVCDILQSVSVDTEDA